MTNNKAIKANPVGLIKLVQEILEGGVDSNGQPLTTEQVGTLKLRLKKYKDVLEEQNK